MAAKKRVIIIHGYGATPRSHWFPWLATQLPGVQFDVPELGDPMRPEVESWIDVATKALARADENTVVVGHSLGAIAMLTALASLPTERKLAGVVLVAGFAEPLPGYDSLDAFTSDVPDIEALRGLTNNRTVFVSDKDDIVDPAITKRLAVRFDAELVVVPRAGHFQETEGKVEFPELIPILAVAGVTTI